MARETHLYLDFVFAGEAADDAQRLLEAALAAAPIASILIRDETGAALDRAGGRLVSLAQKHGVATLIAGPLDRARELASDGVHLMWSNDIVARFKEARRSAFEGAIIGADAGRTRHDAMELGDAGADYVAFGIPPHVEDRARAAERRLNLVGWWSELFEVPSVAFDVAEPAEAARLAEAGADFVGVTLTHDTPLEEAKRRLRSFADAIGLHERAE